jgi:molybdopterin biosynthesis enzyme
VTLPGDLAPGQAIEIMTGAPIPNGADAVNDRHPPRYQVIIDRSSAQQFIDPKGCEAAAGDIF